MSVARVELDGTPSHTLDDLIAGRLPDDRGRFGPFGGRFVPEILVPALDRLELAVQEALSDPSFQRDLSRELH
ncbi:MAG: hypothetical protein O6851_05270, partial [Gemmatimonadetes bacterium]|nr:hypothetical protein [Gemmatimonadota bacterium]